MIFTFTCESRGNIRVKARESEVILLSSFIHYHQQKQVRHIWISAKNAAIFHLSIDFKLANMMSKINVTSNGVCFKSLKVD